VIRRQRSIITISKLITNMSMHVHAYVRFCCSQASKSKEHAPVVETCKLVGLHLQDLHERSNSAKKRRRQVLWPAAKTAASYAFADREPLSKPPASYPSRRRAVSALSEPSSKPSELQANSNQEVSTYMLRSLAS